MENKEIEELTYRHGRILIYNSDQITSIIKTTLNRTYQEHIINALRKWSRPDAVVLDVGANVGVFTIPMSKFVGPKGKVYAFEPVSHSYDLLQKNIKLNNLTNVECLKVALSNKAGKQIINNYSSKKNFSLGHSTLSNISDKVLFSEKIQTQRLDDFHLNNISFIKVDIEGHEPFFLEGALETIKNNKPVLAIELPLRTDQEKTKFRQCIDLLKSIDYLFVKHLSSKDCLFLPNDRANKVINSSEKIQRGIKELEKTIKMSPVNP